MSKRHALWFMTAVLLTAALLRLPALEQFPPGLHYDEAANRILAGDIGLRGARPIFISSYTGKETLFFYLAGGLMRLLGEHTFTLRLTSAFVGLLTVAVTYALGREITRHSRLVPLLAAGLLATSFWHLLFSRLGFRVITQPLLQAITLWLLLRGVRLWLDGQRPWGIFAAAGLALGLAGHTYLAVRLFPLLLGLAAVPLVPRWRELWRPLALTLALALLVLSPLLYHFASQPETFWVRIGQVGEDGLTLGESVWRSVLMFGWRGDPYMRFNLPDMPLFNPLWAVLGVGGLLAVSYKLLAFGGGTAKAVTTNLSTQHSALLLLLLNPLVMLLPTALATNEIVPSNLRALGMLPLLMFLPALGVEWVTAKAATTNFLRSSLLVLLFMQAGLTGWLYFGDWGTRADVFYENDGDLAAVATYLNSHMPSDQPLFVATLHIPHPTLAALADDYDQLRLIPHARALVLPASGRATYIFPRNVPVPVWMRPLLPPPAQLGLLGPDGEPTFAVYHVDGSRWGQPSQPLTSNFSHALTLTGYDVGSGASGADLPLTLYWEVTGQPAESVLAYAHLEDSTGFRWSQTEQDGYPTVFWERGDRVIQHVAVPIRAGAPPGAYQLRVGWFAPASGRPLARLDGDGRFAGNALLIENSFVLPASAPPAQLPIPPVVVGEELEAGLRLLGYEPAPAMAVAGQPISVGMWWAAERPLPPLLVRLELIGANNVGKILTTRPPAQGTYPFGEWPSPAFVVDRQTVEVPLDTAEGRYRVQLSLVGGAGVVGTAALGEVEILASERLFAVPEVGTAVEAEFGQEMRLVGYDLAGGELTLVWQAVGRPSADYTIFVHLLNPDGTCCAWQVDAMPRANSYPTTLWLPEEVVVETYTIELPESVGTYPLEVGVYVAENGVRLAVAGRDSEGDFVYLRPIVVE